MWLRQPASATQVTHGQRLWLYAIASAAMIFLVLPTLVVIPMSFSGSVFLRFPPETWSLRWYEAYFASPEWTRATLTSFKVGVFTAVFATPLGTACAYAAARSNAKLAPFAYGFFLLPIVVPVILLGIGVYLVFARLGLLNTIAGLVAAHTLLATPLAFVVMMAAFSQADRDLELAARGLGAAPVPAFFKVMLPQVKIGVVTSALLSFLTSFDEVVIALLIADRDAATVTRRMFLALRDQIDPVIAAISTMMICLSIVLIVLIQVINSRRAS